MTKTPWALLAPGVALPSQAILIAYHPFDDASRESPHGHVSPLLEKNRRKPHVGRHRSLAEAVGSVVSEGGTTTTTVPEASLTGGNKFFFAVKEN